MRRFAWFLLPAAAFCQILTNPGDPRPLGETGRPVSMAGSPFEIWIAYPTSMVMFPRVGPARPRWYGIAQGLPNEGISNLCFDDASQSLWIGSTTGRSFRWSQGFESASESSKPSGGCQSHSSRNVSVSDLPALMPNQPGWVQSGTDLVSPDGLHQRIRQGLVMDGRELWVATESGIWSGNSSTGRISLLPTGLAESCVRSLVRDSSGRSWMLGCQGSISLVDATDRFESSFIQDDPRSGDLKSPRLLGPAGTDGIWVSVLDGIQRMDSRGVQDRFYGRRAPFGGRALSCVEQSDTLWCGMESSLVRRSSADKSFRTEPPPWESPVPVHTLLPSPVGLIAATRNGFWWHGPKGWQRPSFIPGSERATITLAVVEPVEPFRIAWTDGRILHLDTLPGHPGTTATWIPDSKVSDLSFDRNGRIHLALGGGWDIWNPSTAEHRQWRAGLGLTGDVSLVSPGFDRILLAGEGGAVSVRIAPYAPVPQSSAR